MTLPIDLTSAETAPFESTEAHALLRTCVGLWSGPTKLWLDPSAPPEETTTTLHAELLLGGRWLRASYEGVAFAKPWIDSSHTGSAIMFSKGTHAQPGVIDVLGSYLAGEQRWGWRTVLHSPAAGELTLESFNVSPQGQQERAIESRLTRVKQSASGKPPTT
jgi:hypothetical protein